MNTLKLSMHMLKIGNIWVERYAEHIASATVRLVATVERTDLAIVAGDLAVG